MRRSPFAAFAGIFVVTLLSLMAVGAVLPVLPRYVAGPLDSGNIAVGRRRSARSRFTGLAGRPLAGRLRRPPRPAPDRSSLGTLLAALRGASLLRSRRASRA